MIKNLKLKAKVKLYLCLGNIALGAMLLALVMYWFMFGRASQIAKATQLGQYGTYSIADLSSSNDKIETDYVDLQKQIADTSEEAMEIDIELGSIEDGLKLDGEIEQKDQIPTKSDELLTSKNKAKAFPIKKKGVHSGKPKVSIVVTNLGLNRRSTELALTLPTQ